MTPEENINIAIIGATSKFKGFGDNIASSASFSKNLNDVKAITEIDKEFTSFYDAYPDAYAEQVQYFCFPKTIANRNCFLTIRAKRKFTPFPEQNRFYDRREYFYFDINSNIDSTEFVFSLPIMVQYENKQLGQLNAFEIKKIPHRPDANLIKLIVSHLLNQAALILEVGNSVPDETNGKLLSSINSLPSSYKKYLGFGFNLKSNSLFTKNHLHVFSTFDNGYSDIKGSHLGLVDDETINEFSIALMEGQSSYNETEIVLLDTPLNRNTIFELVRYHFLHFRIDKYSVIYAPESETEILFLQSKKYVESFLTKSFISNSYILNRIKQGYIFWQVNNLINKDLFLWFWKNLVMAGVDLKKFYGDPKIRQSIDEFIELEYRYISNFREIDLRYADLNQVPSPKPNISLLDEMKIKYYSSGTSDIHDLHQMNEYIRSIAKVTDIKFQDDLFEKIDPTQVNTLSNDQAFEILEDKEDKLDSDLIIILIKHIGLNKLLIMLQSKEEQVVLKNKKVRKVVLAVLEKDSHFDEVLKWLSFFRNKNIKYSFDMQSYLNKQANKINYKNNQFLFDSLCSSIINNKEIFKNNEVKNFIDQILEKKGCQDITFYSSAFRVAEKFHFKVFVHNHSLRYEKKIFDFISLLDRNQALLSNAHLINELSDNYIDDFVSSNKNIAEVINFSESHSFFVSENENKFIDIIDKLFLRANQFEKHTIVLLLFKHIIRSEKNMFLKSNSKLLDSINKFTVTDKSFVKDIYKLGLQINKNNNPNFEIIKDLNDLLINSYFHDLGQNKNLIVKMKNKIAFINRNAKIIFVLLLCVLGYEIIVNMNATKENRLLESDNDRLARQIILLKDSMQVIHNNINQSPDKPIENSAPGLVVLLPQPNTELNPKDLRIINKQNIKSQSVSDITAIIFDKNHGDILAYYKDQRDLYMEELIKRNSSCFDQNKIFVCDSLVHIPSYKKGASSQ